MLRRSPKREILEGGKVHVAESKSRGKMFAPHIAEGAERRGQHDGIFILIASKGVESRRVAGGHATRQGPMLWRRRRELLAPPKKGHNRRR